MDFYQEMQAFAHEMIADDECFNPNKVRNLWVKQGERILSNTKQPWRSQPNPAGNVEHEVSICYLPDELEDRQLIQFRKGSTTPKGEVNGLMAHYSEFKPELDDIVKRPLGDGQEGYEQLVVTFVNPLRPQATTVMYYLEFRR